MNPSFIQHAFGPNALICHKTEYKDSSIYLHVQTKPEKLVCPVCGSHHIVKYGYVERDFRSVPIGSKSVWLHMKVQKLKCKDCGEIHQEHLKFVTGHRWYTHKFANYVIDLLRMGTLKDVARHLHISWDTVKDIHKNYLENNYAYPDIRGVKNIGIDEFAVKKGHVYKTIVVDLDSGRIIYVGDGKGKDSLVKFWKKVKRQNVNIEHIASDLSPAFTASILENAPKAIHVFDHFHVVKLMNEALDDIRRELWRDEKDLNKRNVIKGTRWLLLANGKDIFDSCHKNRLENALKLNEPLTKAYYLKEDLREIWNQTDKAAAEAKLNDWIKQAQDSGLKQLRKMAGTLMAYRSGILAWYDCRISNGKVEGINNKIKVMKRRAYGFRDDRYLELRLYGLHDATNANVG